MPSVYNEIQRLQRELRATALNEVENQLLSAQLEAEDDLIAFLAREATGAKSAPVKSAVWTLRATQFEEVAGLKEVYEKLARAYKLHLDLEVLLDVVEETGSCLSDDALAQLDMGSLHTHTITTTSSPSCATGVPESFCLSYDLSNVGQFQNGEDEVQSRPVSGAPSIAADQLPTTESERIDMALRISDTLTRLVTPTGQEDVGAPVQSHMANIASSLQALQEALRGGGSSTCRLQPLEDSTRQDAGGRPAVACNAGTENQDPTLGVPAIQKADKQASSFTKQLTSVLAEPTPENLRQANRYLERLVLAYSSVQKGRQICSLVGMDRPPFWMLENWTSTFNFNQAQAYRAIDGMRSLPLP